MRVKQSIAALAIVVLSLTLLGAVRDLRGSSLSAATSEEPLWDFSGIVITSDTSCLRTDATPSVATCGTDKSTSMSWHRRVQVTKLHVTLVQQPTAGSQCDFTFTDDAGTDIVGQTDLSTGTSETQFTVNSQTQDFQVAVGTTIKIAVTGACNTAGTDPAYNVVVLGRYI